MKTHLMAAGRAFGFAGGCGGGPRAKPPDDTILCSSGNCGKPSFRNAVPDRRTVQIDSQGGRRRDTATKDGAATEDNQSIVAVYVDNQSQVPDQP